MPESSLNDDMNAAYVLPHTSAGVHDTRRPTTRSQPSPRSLHVTGSRLTAAATAWRWALHAEQGCR
jgi:hypothetical protein